MTRDRSGLFNLQRGLFHPLLLANLQTLSSFATQTPVQQSWSMVVFGNSKQVWD
jgi:hypothetical protein